MNGEGFDEPGRAGGRDPRRPHRSSRPLWLGGMPQPGAPAEAGRAGAGRAGAEDDPGAYGYDLGDASMCCEACDRPHDPATCRHCATARGSEAEVDGAPDGIGDLVCHGCADPDLGEIVVILLVSTLAGLRDRLERDGFASAAGLVHDLVEVADDYVTRFHA